MKRAVNLRVSPLGAPYFLDFLHGDLFEWGLVKQGLIRGGLKNFLSSSSYSSTNFLLVDCFFYATHTINTIFFKGQVKFY